MKRVSPGQIIANERIVSLSEIKHREIKIRKIFDNWFLIIIVCVGAYTARIVADELAMKAKAYMAVKNGN